MRDHKKLEVFGLADRLAVDVYQATSEFPRSELFGLTSQLRRASVSVVSNIVEGSARHTIKSYISFLDIAYGSACEVHYQLSLADRLGYLPKSTYEDLSQTSLRTSKALGSLLRTLRRRHAG